MAQTWFPFGRALRAASNPPPSWQAASIIPEGNPASPKNMAARQKDWQKKVLHFADAIPEVTATGSYVRNTLNKVQWRVEGTANDAELEMLTRGLKWFRAGRIAENLHYVGEMLVEYNYDPATGNVDWTDYSHAEWKRDHSGLHVADSSGNLVVVDEEEANIFRVWRQDRSKKHKPWSPHKSMLTTLEGMYLYQLVDTRLAQSRLAGAGILHIPGDDLPITPPTGDGKPMPDSREEFLEEFVDSMLQPVRDGNSDDAVVPFVMFGKAEYADAIRHILTERIDDAAGFKERMDAYAARYARGVDLPVEVVLGIADLNHWNAWKVDDDTWKYSLAPVAERIAASLTRNYAEPLLALLGGTGEVTVVADPQDLVQRPDRSEIALKAHAQGVITTEAAADATGFSEDEVGDGVPLQAQNPGVAGEPLSQDFRKAPPIQAASVGARQLASLSARLNRNEHELNRELVELQDEWLNRILDAKRRGIVAQVDPNDNSPEAEAQRYEENVKETVASRMGRKVSLMAAALGLKKDETTKYAQVIDERSSAAAIAARAHATFITERAIEMGRKRVVPNATSVRTIINISHGGQNTPNENLTAQTERPEDLATDSLVQDIFDDAEVPVVQQYTWVRGNPSDPFEPHVPLEGTQWLKGEDEGQVLGTHPFNSTGNIYPGDHVGCQCEYEIQFVEVPTGGVQT